MPTITHTVSEPWRSHLRAAIAEIESSRDEELRLLGMVHEARERAIRRRASLEEIIRLIAREAELPDISYDVAKDGSAIMGNVPDPPASPTS